MTDYDGQEPAWVPHLIRALEGLRTGVREFTDDQKAIIAEHGFLKDHLAGPGLTPPGPVVTRFNPTSGPVGTNVTIVGERFGTPIAVHFSGARSDTPTLNGDGSLTVAVPPGAATGRLTVLTAQGAGASKDKFTVSGGPPPPTPGDATLKSGKSIGA
ncbi:IPT/TIG domain-containing protein [Pseudonocardia sp. T1-2H]|uniref:IPT/TIG domain-containing protein n=1 Tax=Pseudonocardia sp. T1-2H TaxID=3128899 RepID=UPI00310196E9